MPIKLFNYISYYSRKNETACEKQATTAFCYISFNAGFTRIYTVIRCTRSVQMEIAYMSKPNSYFHRVYLLRIVH